MPRQGLLHISENRRFGVQEKRMSDGKITIKSESQRALMRAAGELTGRTLNYIETLIKPGISTKELDEAAEEFIRSHGAVPSFLNYEGFPASICTSVNDRIVHGIPSRHDRLRDGDIISVDCGTLNPNEQVGDVLRSGTLGIGFIGGHNAMVALYGEGHGHSQKAWDTLYEAVTEMNKIADEYKAKYNLNYSVLATPAEGLSGRFTKMDRRKFGKIPGVTDRDYYVNSFHVDVKEPISIVEKIKCEAPFHAITRGGHITYVELDGEAQKNVRAIAKIVKVMHDEGIGYGSINHPVDTCHNCGYKGVIFDKCPVCQSESILRMRRITGYLTGDLSSWNSAKRAEEKDRVKHL